MRRVRVLHRSTAFGREQRVAESIRKELARLIRQKMRDPRIDNDCVTLTDVRVTRDLAFADVYVQSLDLVDANERQMFVNVLERAAGFLRSGLAKQMATRTVPQLRFHYDDLEESGNRLDALIDESMRKETAVESTVGD